MLQNNINNGVVGLNHEAAGAEQESSDIVGPKESGQLVELCSEEEAKEGENSNIASKTRSGTLASVEEEMVSEGEAGEVVHHFRPTNMNIAIPFRHVPEYQREISESTDYSESLMAIRTGSDFDRAFQDDGIKERGIMVEGGRDKAVSIEGVTERGDDTISGMEIPLVPLQRLSSSLTTNSAGASGYESGDELGFDDESNDILKESSSGGFEQEAAQSGAGVELAEYETNAILTPKVTPKKYGPSHKAADEHREDIPEEGDDLNHASSSGSEGAVLQSSLGRRDSAGGHGADEFFTRNENEDLLQAEKEEGSEADDSKSVSSASSSESAGTLSQTSIETDRGELTDLYNTNHNTELEAAADGGIPLPNLPTMSGIFMGIVNDAVNALNALGRSAAHLFNEAEAMWQAMYGQGGYDDEAEVEAEAEAGPAAGGDGYGYDTVFGAFIGDYIDDGQGGVPPEFDAPTGLGGFSSISGSWQ